MPLTLCRLEPDTEVVHRRARDARLRPDRRALRDRAARRRRRSRASGRFTSSSSARSSGVARAKAELIDALPRGGVAVVPAAAPELEPYLAETDVEIRPLRPEDVLSVEVDGIAPHAVFSLDVDGERVDARTSSRATTRQHARRRSHAYDALGLPLDRAQRRRRGDRVLTLARRGAASSPGGGLLINDAYNANPVSMRAALDHLVGTRRLAATRRGARATWPSSGRTRRRYHDEVGAARRDASASTCSSPSARSRAATSKARRDPRGARGADVDEATAALDGLVQPGDCVLVKASRAMGLEARGGRARGGAGFESASSSPGSSRWSSRSSIGPRFIAFLRRKELGQYIREEGPKGHVVKQGTPTMGGVLIVAAAAARVPRAQPLHDSPALTVFFATVACGAVGFLDDFIKLTHRRSLGLAGRWKLMLLLAIAAVVGVPRARPRADDRRSTCRSSASELPLSWGWYPFVVLRDRRRRERRQPHRRDRRARRGRRASIALFTFTAMNVLTYIRARPDAASRASPTSTSRSSAPR